MNFLEAMKLCIIYDKKVTRTDQDYKIWNNIKYIFYNGDLLSICNNNNNERRPYHISTSDILNDDWEIYLEDKPKTYSFQEALKALEEGKKISRPFKLAPGRKRILQKIVNDNGSFIMYADDEKKEHEIYKLDQLSFNYEAIVATDWIIEE